MDVQVFMVAEKPSLSWSIAQFLAGDGEVQSFKRILDVHEFKGQFQGRPAHFRMTSVIGHVMNADFPAAYQSWDNVNPLSLFDAPTIKSEANPKARIGQHLAQEAQGCDYLVLWLDCDREGENICFEVMEHAVPSLRRQQGSQVFRAKFSAVSEAEVQSAMRSLGEPNQNEAWSVDARQELDLKVGVAFTRFQTRYFQGRYANLHTAVVSYGPCQTPTLNFCVERHQLIQRFVPEPFWAVKPKACKQGAPLELEWARGRVFDQDVGRVFQSVVADARRLKVVSVRQQEERRPRPAGLNTVELLKVASAKLGIGPATAMHVAERLYIQGFISYPRTETTAYTDGFDLAAALGAQRRHPVWGDYAAGLLAQGVQRPQGGVDAGDHPPITPVAAAAEAEVGGGDAWRIYDYVSRHFLASLSSDCVLRKTKAVLQAGGETFTVSGAVVVRPGFTAVMPWKQTQEAALPPLEQGELLQIEAVDMRQGSTSPPSYLTEAELIGLMEKNGIGTDASIATHISNICERNYVRVGAGRTMVPTELGVTLIRGYQGKADKEAVVKHVLRQFTQKFVFFVLRIGRMDALFEASFSPLAAAGKTLSKCGKCNRYMKYIPARPSRLYCPVCEEVYHLPQGGTVKLYLEHTCPLDGFQLLLFCLGGQDGKKYPLCPFCFNQPPFANVTKFATEGTLRPGMPCNLCPSPSCRHSMVRKGVSHCGECEDGTLVLDPVSVPQRLNCNRCSFLIYLPKNLRSAKVKHRQRCEDCSAAYMELEWKAGSSPLPSDDSTWIGCVVCDDTVQELCELKHGRSWVKRPGRGRGRGRGRRRGRGRGRDVDPRMTFHGF